MQYLHKILVAVLVAVLLTASGCKVDGENTSNNNNWDSMKWDQGNWR